MEGRGFRSPFGEGRTGEARSPNLNVREPADGGCHWVDQAPGLISNAAARLKFIGAIAHPKAIRAYCLEISRFREGTAPDRQRWNLLKGVTSQGG
jgi:hypothetical protein